MYLDFYGLKENPFTLVTEPRFLYYSESHCEAMAHLLYGVRERKGIIAMFGEAGTGKTTLIRATLGLLRQSRVVPSVILNPMVASAEELLDAVLHGFGITARGKSSLEKAEVLQQFAMQETRAGRIVVILVDEAQELSRHVLEQLRLLSNLEDQNEKLLQIVLSAQPEFRDKLEDHDFRAMRQRITVRCRLHALNAQETWRYLYHRLAIAGGKTEIFTPDAVEALYAYSTGIPRILNSLADNCLLAGFSRGFPQVSGAIVEQVAKHLELQAPTAMLRESDSIHKDIMRASATWKEVVADIRGGDVPAALRAFVEKLQVQDRGNAPLTTAMRRGAQI
jgi:general secretion pathway protein A